MALCKNVPLVDCVSGGYSWLAGGQLGMDWGVSVQGSQGMGQGFPVWLPVRAALAGQPVLKSSKSRELPGGQTAGPSLTGHL